MAETYMTRQGRYGLREAEIEDDSVYRATLHQKVVFQVPGFKAYGPWDLYGTGRSLVIITIQGCLSWATTFL